MHLSLAQRVPPAKHELGPSFALSPSLRSPRILAPAAAATPFCNRLRLT
jgi:hypothetical protein